MNLLKKVLLACLLGIAFTFFIIQNQDDFKINVQHQIEQIFLKTFDCEFRCKVKSLNLFFPCIELETVSVKDKNVQTWNWFAKNLCFDCSWIDFLLKGKFKADISINNGEFFSELENGDFAILKHIKKLLLSNNSNFPLLINSLKLNNASLKVVENNLDITTNLDFNSELKTVNSNSRFIFYLKKGEINNKEKIIANDLSGLLLINIPQDNFQKSSIEINGLSNLPILKINDDKCFYKGKWDENTKFLKIGTIDGKLNLNCLNFYSEKNLLNLDLIFEGSIKYLQKFFNLNLDSIDGDFTLNLKTDINKNNMSGECIIKNLSHENKQVNFFDKLSFCFVKNIKSANGNVNLFKNENSIFSGNWKLDLTKKLKLNYSGASINQLNQINLNGQIVFQDSIKAIGKINNQTFDLNLKLKPFLKIKNFVIFNEQNQPCIKINSNKNVFKANVYFENIHNFLTDFCKLDLVGQGEIIINGQYVNEKVEGSISSNNLNITCSKIYNLIKQVNGKINLDLVNKKIEIFNAILALDKGHLESDKVKILFDSFKPSFIYLPITIKNVLFSWKKDIIASLSGHLLLNKLPNFNAQLSGFLYVQDAQINNNIFSSEFNNNLLNKYDLNYNNKHNLNLDVSIISKNSIHIKTPFLKTTAQLDIKLLNNLFKPSILGIIELTKGLVVFPYKNLNIISGYINFLPNQFDDPLINLTAKNKINRYNITMHVTGTINDQNIKFESSPPLNDEQIMALLLVGNEKSSMNMIMPSLVMKNVKNIFSGSSATHSGIKKYFDSLLKPLRFIKIIPNFNSETGRPGFKGSINILNDRFRVQLQKNFTLAEDTRFDIDYCITDEISLKATKDERGDLGGEIEMRWKF